MNFFRSDISSLIRRRNHIGTTVEEKINKIRTEKNLDDVKEEKEGKEASDEDDDDELVRLLAIIQRNLES